MAQRIDDTAESQYTVNAGPEATKLAKDISKASGFLSTNVERMTRDLRLFVSTLEDIQVKVEKKRLAEQILRWLKLLFKAIANIFATLTPSISGTVRHHPDPKVRGGALAGTALRQAASEFRVTGAFLELIPLQGRK
jgi:hypothetical protein